MRTLPSAPCCVLADMFAVVLICDGGLKSVRRCADLGLGCVRDPASGWERLSRPNGRVPLWCCSREICLSLQVSDVRRRCQTCCICTRCSGVVQ